MLIKLIIGFALGASMAVAAAPATFNESKLLLRQVETNSQEFYCGCKFRYTRGSSGIVDLRSCGYEVVSDAKRASRIEVDHVFSMASAARDLPCWKRGGRSECQRTSSEFNRLESDMFNLQISIGEVNKLKSFYRFAELGVEPGQFGACDAAVDPKARLFQPRASIRGVISRAAFYMAETYKMPLSKREQVLFLRWHKEHPVTKAERLRHDHIAMLMGHSNPYVTGAKSWSLR